MKPRHAAAFALVGWYLMVPPLSADHHQVNYSAPFTAWVNLEKYASQKKCEQMRTQFASEDAQDFASVFILKESRDQAAANAAKNALKSARCFRIDEVAN
jgi:hypothetical protein